MVAMISAFLVSEEVVMVVMADMQVVGDREQIEQQVNSLIYLGFY